MDRGKGSISKHALAKILNLKWKIVFALVAIGTCFIAFFVLFIISSHQSFFPLGTSAELVGLSSTMDDEKTTNELSTLYPLHRYDEDNDKDGELDNLYSEETAEVNHFFQELTRQRTIWVDDYKQFGINHYAGNPFLLIDDYQTNDLDMLKPLVTVHYQGNVYVNSHFMNFNDSYDEMEIKPDGTLLNEYEGEKLVNNRDTRDFYEKAKNNLGSTFFIYPGSRKMFGNLIGASIRFYPVEAVYTIDKDCKPTISNELAILSDWGYIGQMSLKDEAAYQSFLDNDISGPYTNAGYYAKAFAYGYDYCLGDMRETIEDEWEYLNICNDYQLLFKEAGPISSSRRIGSAAELENAIRMAASPTSKLRIAELPSRESNRKTNKVEGCNYCSPGTKTFPSCPGKYYSGEYYIAVDIERFEDKDLYDSYMEEVYIPYFYPESSVSQILSEMKLYEEAYRHYNGEEFMGLGSNNSSGSSVIVGGTYQCGNMNINISGDYCDGPDADKCRSHNAVDVSTNVKHPNVKPLLGGKVYSVHNSCPNSPVCPYADAMLFVTGGSISDVSPACLCGDKLGNHVVIESTYNGKTYYTVYAHLSAVNVNVGDEVTTDTIIGVMGTTGMSTGDHLHIEMHEGNRWNPKFTPEELFSKSQIGSSICDDEGEDTDEKEV